MTGPWPEAVAAVTRLTDRRELVAVAESLTGGLVTARLVDVPGASAVLRGGVVAYASDLKAALLDVPADLLAARGAVDPDVARAMADGVRCRLGAQWGVATTGMAGPTGQDGRPAGTVFIAVHGPDGAGVDQVRELHLRGDRPRVREAAARAAIALLADILAGTSALPR